jgi:peptidoglycan/LPS O-acetylase OafA/YrhL
MPAAYQTYLSQKHFGSLDGLRAISIVMVIWHHTAPANVEPMFRHFGAEGVTLFFAISGFLITTLLLRERRRNNGIDLKAFYIRRSLRIMPLYFAVLGIYAVLVVLLERDSEVGDAFFRNLIFFATYTSNIFVELDNRTIFYFAWSLATEEQFYLIWPLFLAFSRNEKVACLPLILVITICTVALFSGSTMLLKIPISLLGGSLLALILHLEKGFNVVYLVLQHGATQLTVPVLLVISLFSVSGSTLVVHVLCIALVAQSVVQERHIFHWILTLRPMVYIGSISYGMYMLHMLAKNTVLKMLALLSLSISAYWIFPLTLLLAILAGTLSFQYFESFFLKYKKSFEK